MSTLNVSIGEHSWRSISQHGGLGVGGPSPRSVGAVGSRFDPERTHVESQDSASVASLSVAIRSLKAHEADKLSEHDVELLI